MCAQQAVMGTVLRTVQRSPFTFTRCVNDLAVTIGTTSGTILDNG